MKIIDDFLLWAIPKLPIAPQKLIDHTYTVCTRRVQETQADIIRLRWDKVAADQKLKEMR